jgi:hypothetical protein
MGGTEVNPESLAFHSVSLPGVLTVTVPVTSLFLSFCYRIDMNYSTEQKICWQRTSGNNFIRILQVRI